MSPSNIGHLFIKKMELTSIEKNPDPGDLRALISVSLQYGLHFGVNGPLFDRKLLDCLHEQGVRSIIDANEISVLRGGCRCPGHEVFRAQFGLRLPYS